MPDAHANLDRAAAPPLTQALRLTLALCLIGVGVLTWWRFAEWAGLTPERVAWLALALLTALIPRPRRAVAAALDHLRDPSPRARRFIAVGVATASVIYLYVAAAQQQRDFIPKFHDEHMHLLQMRMMSQGRLWMPAHELADFFDTFHVLVRPVYASIYFPGTALLYLPSMWLNLPAWLLPLLAAGATVGLLYRILTELLDGVAGMLAALLLLSLSTFRFLSLMVMSHSAVVLLGLGLVWAYLNWRQRTRAAGGAGGGTLRWVAVMGALAGWAAITRPLDAIAFAAPVAIAVLLDLRRLDWRRRGATVAVAVAAAVPFVALQLVENVGVTGSFFHTPHQLYARQDNPGLSVGLGGATTGQREVRSFLPQKRAFYDEFLGPQIERHRSGTIARELIRRRLPDVAYATLGSALLLIVLPGFVLAGGAAVGRAAVLWAVLPLYVLLYLTFPLMLAHYMIVVAPAVTVLVLLGVRGIERSLPRRLRVAGEVFLTLSIAGACVWMLPPINRAVRDGSYPTPAVRFAAVSLPRLVKPPAIVLVRFSPGDDFHDEPVYNLDVAWPDDAPIIRAHDLGPARNAQLFDYYATRQPDRTVYLFVRRTGGLTRLGNVADLARRSAPGASTTRHEL